MQQLCFESIPIVYFILTFLVHNHCMSKGRANGRWCVRSTRDQQKDVHFSQCTSFPFAYKFNWGEELIHLTSFFWLRLVSSFHTNTCNCEQRQALIPISNLTERDPNHFYHRNQQIANVSFGGALLSPLVFSFAPNTQPPLSKVEALVSLRLGYCFFIFPF